MRQFNTLTGFLGSKASNPTTSDTVEFQGFTAIGDGYAAKFQHNGVTGQTPSQSPIDLGLAVPTLNDLDGNQWVLIDGAVQEFDTVLFYPSPFGDSGKGMYAYLESVWVKLSDTTFIPPMTTTELINSSASFSSDIIIPSTGFTTSGDTGAGSWIQNGVTGQTASQSPAQLADALLNDANGDQWVVVTSGKPPSLNSLGADTSQSLGGADSIDDSYPLMLAIINWCSTNNYFGIADVLDSGYYRLSQPVYVNQQLTLRGKGKKESYLHANHLLGDVIRFGESNSGLISIGVTGGATRRATAYSPLQIGVRFEGDDVPEGDPGAPRSLHCVMDDYYVTGQPSSAVHIVGPAFTGNLNHPDISGVKGHGISFDRGELTNRVNLITALISGICRIGEGRISNCGGHAVACGSSTSAYSTPALRVVIDNIEGGNNATDAAVRFFDAPIFLRGANHVFQNSGLSVNTGGSSAVVAGRNIHLKNNRMLGDYANAYKIVSYDELPTEGIFIDGMSVISPNATLDPAVLVSLPAGETVAPKNIFINQGEMVNISKIAGTDSSLGNGDFRRIAGLYFNGSTLNCWKESDTIVNNSTSLVNDDDLRMWLSENERVQFEINIEYESTTSADIRLQLYAPALSVFRSVSVGSMQVSTSNVFQVASTTTGLINVGGGGVGISRIATIKGYALNGSNEGYLGVKFAQLSAEVSDTKIIAGISNLKIQRLIS